jgi:hypothetical protein
MAVNSNDSLKKAKIAIEPNSKAIGAFFAPAPG